MVIQIYKLFIISKSSHYCYTKRKNLRVYYASCYTSGTLRQRNMVRYLGCLHCTVSKMLLSQCGTVVYLTVYVGFFGNIKLFQDVHKTTFADSMHRL